MSLDGLESAAFRRLIHELSGKQEHELEEMSPVEKVNAALERIDALQSENEELRKRVIELESQVDPDPTGKPYDELSRAEKVRKVRETIFKEAESRNTGKAKMDYRDVMMLFDNRPSPGHAYDLMKIAGEEDGFRYDDSDNKALLVDSDAVKDEAYFHAANKASVEEGA